MVEGEIGIPGNFEVTDAEKTFVKDHMIEVLIHCSDQVSLRSQALECVKLVINREYPLRWSTFLCQCLSLVGSGDQTKVFCGLACLRVISREFEMKSSGTSRQPLEELIVHAMPGLLTLGEQLIANAPLDEARGSMVKLILKIFYSAVQLRLSPLLADHAVCTRWFELCCSVTKLAAPNGEDLEEGVHAKLHKWAFRILHRFFARYGNPDLTDFGGEESAPDTKEFARWWLSTFAPPLVGIISDALSKEKISRAAKYQAISFLGEAIQHSTSYKALKPRLNQILFEVIFPLMCFSAQDGELWESDPDEFIRREFDCMYSFSDPKSAAVELLKNLVSMRSKDCLGSILKFCEMHLTPVNGDLQSYCRKDGALAIIGSIAPQLCVACKKSGKKKVKKVAVSLPNRSQLEALLAQYVLCDFVSPVGFLRYRACWVYQQFADEEFEFGDRVSTLGAFEGYKKCLSDSELPVRVQAGCSVKSFITTADFAPMIQPAVPTLLDQLLRLMHEVDCEALASTLESLVSEFAEEVLPFAGQAIEQLGKVFIRLSESADDNDEAQMACMGSIQTICTILESATGPMYASLEQVCYPILDRIFTVEGIDYMEEGLDILTYLTFYCPEPLSAGLWKYFDILHASVCASDNWAVDYVENMLNVFDNYISRCPSQFVGGTGICGRPYIQMVYEICQKSLADDCEVTQIAGAKIAACIFESCSKIGVVDACLGEFLGLFWTKFSAEQTGLNRWIFYLIVMMMYYDYATTLLAAETRGIANDVLECMYKLPKFAKSKDERKALCLSLCGLLTGGVGNAKEYIQVLALQTREIAELRKKARLAALEGSENDDDEDDDEFDEDIQDLDEDESADQSGKLRLSNRLREEIAMIREQIAGTNESFADDETDSDYEDEDDEDCERVSPLDAFSEFKAIKDVLVKIESEKLLGWFSKDDLIAWNQILDENIANDAQDRASGGA